MIANIYIEAFDEIELKTTTNKLKKWIRYIDDILIICNYSHEKFYEFFKRANEINSIIKYTMKKEESERLPFLDALVECQNLRV